MSARRQRGNVGLGVVIAGLAALVIGVGIGANIGFERMFGGTARAEKPAPVAATQVALAASASTAAAPASDPETVAPKGPKKFVPPPESSMPTGEYGDVIKLGEKVFMDTPKYAAKWTGNTLSCANCHLDAGRKTESAPLWAAFIHYPAYRKKTGKVDTLASRIQGCFMYSMDGKAPPQDDEVMTALQTYAYWLAKGAPVDTHVAGELYPKLKKPEQAPDYERGQKVYEQNCALCHGADGQGQRVADRQVFPPLWGPKSFNWGAGMHQLGNAAGFIQANMPLGKGGSLSLQQAWDVSKFMNSHERPQDPRFIGSVAETRKKYHDSEDSMYGLTVDGHVLGSLTAKR
jgi:thiosulfate dehydrogenase